MRNITPRLLALMVVLAPASAAPQSPRAATYITAEEIIIPAGVPHGWIEIADHVDYLSVRPDPDRVLPKDYVNPAIRK